MKRVTLLIIIALTAITGMAGTTPSRELRSCWLTTVWSIDWPKTTIDNSSSTTQIKAQQAELTAILDTMKACGFNAIFFQIRGMSDVMYPSQYENWSAYLTGTRGKDPGYDPLLFAIQEAHARGMELHAWINPYRYSSSSATYGTLSTDYSKTHPDWILDYGSYTTILNPGIPEVRKRIKDIIGEVINNYDVDGIVFDDYFYAYGGTSSTLDAKTQQQYKPAGQSVGDWRRENINRMIKDVYDTIQAVKPYVRFGVSPFGTWTTDETVAESEGISLPQGVGATGNMYEEIYCDPVAWLKQGTIDYISPQLYWTSTSNYPYGILAKWWSKISSDFGRHFYSSHSTSSLKGAPAATKASKDGIASKSEKIIFRKDTVNVNALTMVERTGIISKAQMFAPSEIETQINFNRQYDRNGAPGSVFYNTGNTLKYASMRKIFKENVFNEKTITPHVDWKHSALPAPPSNITLHGDTLSWQRSDTLYRTAIYVIPDGATSGNISLTPQFLQDVSYGTSYMVKAKGGDVIVLTSIDRYGAESAPKTINWGSTSENGTTNSPAPALIFPANKSNAVTPCFMSWNKSDNAISYNIQLSKDNSFTNLIFNKRTTDTTYNTSTENTIEDGRTYYWRVKSISIGEESDWSVTYSFTAKKFGINNPQNGATGIITTATIEWDSIAGNAQYTLTIAKDRKFTTHSTVYETTCNEPGHTLPDKALNMGTVYYAKVEVTAGEIEAESDVTSFKTESSDIPVPAITTPAEGDVISSDIVTVKWEQQTANGFRVEISQNADFPARQTTGRNTENDVYEYTFENLKKGEWYTRVKAKTPEGYTEYSDTVRFTVDLPSSMETATDDDIYVVIRGNDILEIHTSDNTLHISDIAIMNIAGMQMYGKTLPASAQKETIQLNISNIPNGIYVVKIKTKNGIKICRFKK